MQPLLRHVFDTLTARRDLTIDEARSVFELILTGRLDPATIGGLLGALATKGECVDELVGAAQAMRASAVQIACNADCIDTCGTGGDGTSTFNVSTTAAIIAAAAGATVAKHGNRSTTRASGSTEVLTELGIDVEAAPGLVEKSLREVRIGYLNARLLHPAMKHAAPVRQAIPVRTIFNLLGPLTNPAGAKRQLLGVPRLEFVNLVAEALLKLGATHAWVVHGTIEQNAKGSGSAGPSAGIGKKGICDLSVTGESAVVEVRNGAVRRFTVTPEQAGLASGRLEDLLVDSVADSAEMVRAILGGQVGTPRNQALLNAGAALVVAGVTGDLADGVARAAEAVDDGRAAKTLETWVAISGGHK